MYQRLQHLLQVIVWNFHHKGKTLKKTFILIACILMASCASSSQDAQIEIFPNVTESNTGSGIILSITVDDSRPSGIIGTTGETTQIYTSQDLAETIGVAMVDAFSKQGFSVSAASNPAAVKMMVALEDLSYTRDGNLVTTTVNTTSRMRVALEGKNFGKNYSNSEERVIPFSSSEETNNSQLRSILETIIERIVNDQELLAAIKR